MNAKSVYFIRQGKGGPIKIGITTNIESRMRTFQTASPVPLHLLRLEPGGRRRELQLHHRFRAYRMEGEWFQAGPVLDYIHTAPTNLPTATHHARGAWRRTQKVLSWAGLPLAGLATLATALLPGRRRADGMRALAILTALASASLWYAAQEWWIIAGPVLVAAVLAGLIRRAR